MIVVERYVVCEGCGAREPGDEHPSSWPSIVQDNRAAYYCTRECLNAAILSAPSRSPGARLGLTDRDLVVLRSIAAGETNMQISRRLGKGESTTKNRVSMLIRRLGAQDRASLIVRAYQRGLIDLRAIGTAA